ncbi:sensor histidine kinase [Aestuariivirga sp.]|uniref:sensor histidine kinase n=1 Tax=Aestuariivirga sp. TaxID=2650926 RepID=UPI0035ADA6D1
MRLLAGIIPEKLPVLAALAAATGFTLLLAGAVAVYATVDALGALLMAGFLLASLGLAASGWVWHWRTLSAPSTAHPLVERRSPLRNAGQDSPAHRLLEAVAAEVRGSASTISGFAEVLPADADEAALQHLREASRGLVTFAGQLHDYVRFERGRLRLRAQHVDAAELVAAALAACRGPAEAAATTIVADLPEGIEISCDAERIRQAVASLVTWALQSSTPGGVLDIGLLRLADGGLAIDIAARAEAAGPPQPRDRLFEPQLSLAGLRGFALPIARRVALLHAGEVTAVSSPGEGTTARLTLPAARVAWPEARSTARAA